MADIPYVEASAVRAALPFDRLIKALREAFRGTFEAPERHIHTMPVPGGADATLLLMPAWIAGEAYGVKLANVFPGNGARGLPAVSAIYALFDAMTGRPLAMMEGGELTVRRTMATSALAASFLAPAEARTHLVVGTGRLAPVAVEAHRAARPITRTLIWGRDRAKALAVAEASGAEAVADLEAAVREADIITCVTLSSEPLVRGAWLKPGAHLDLVGAFKPGMREVDAEAVRRAHVFVDTIGGARAEAGDLIQAIAEGAFQWDRVAGDLAALCRGEVSRPADPEAITLFKSVGAAVEDLAAARLVAGSLTPAGG